MSFFFFIAACGARTNPDEATVITVQDAQVDACCRTPAMDIYVRCTTSTQLCTPPYEVDVVTGSTLGVEFSVGPGGCSEIRFVVTVDGSPSRTTDFVGPHGTLRFTLDVVPGMHKLGLQAERPCGRCNSGRLGDWAGTLRLTTCCT